MTPSLASLARSFRTTYLDYATLSDQLNVWAEAFPSIVRLTSIGKTDEGRDLWVLTVGPEPDRARPAVWVDANMHACELAGSSVALAIAEDVIALHLDANATAHGLPAAACDVVRDVLFHIMPRMSPDGAERVLTTRRWVRSSTRDTWPQQGASRWLSEDVDGDGRALFMRQLDPAGDFVSNPNYPRALQPRTIEDEGPFYRLLPEGRIDRFDGVNVPDPHYLSDNRTDLNRNFFVAWEPEPTQAGAGEYALSEPESRAVVEFTAAQPQLFAWLNLHCFGGVLIRPPGDVPDSKMHADERALYAQLEAWTDEQCGYPTVSGFEEFTYEPDKPLSGDIVDYAYKARGCFAWVVELWDIFKRLGIPRPKRFVSYYEQLTPEHLERLVAFDEASNEGRLFPGWRAVEHPQLGAVEVGGFDPLVGLWNPPYDEIAEVCRAQSATLMRVAAMAPRITVSGQVVTAVGATRVDVDVVNLGYLPTYVLPSGRELPHSEPLWLELAATDGLSLVDPAATRIRVGHLEGWGRGRFHPAQSLIYARSRGSSHRRRISVAVTGAGTLAARVGSARVGWKAVEIAVS